MGGPERLGRGGRHGERVAGRRARQPSRRISNAPTGTSGAGSIVPALDVARRRNVYTPSGTKLPPTRPSHVHATEPAGCDRSVPCDGGPVARRVEDRQAGRRGSRQRVCETGRACDRVAVRRCEPRRGGGDGPTVRSTTTEASTDAGSPVAYATSTRPGRRRPRRPSRPRPSRPNDVPGRRGDRDHERTTAEPRSMRTVPSTRDVRRSSGWSRDRRRRRRPARSGRVTDAVRRGPGVSSVTSHVAVAALPAASSIRSVTR